MVHSNCLHAGQLGAYLEKKLEPLAEGLQLLAALQSQQQQLLCLSTLARRRASHFSIAHGNSINLAAGSPQG